MTKSARDSARGLAVRALGRFFRTGERLDAVMADLLRGSDPDPRDRALLGQLCFGVVRRLRLLDHLLDRHLPRPKAVPPEVRHILRIGAYQLLFLDRIPARAAIHHSVELTRAFGAAGLAPLVNAVLRSVQASGNEPARGEPPAVLHSFPDWLALRWVARYGPEEAEALMAAANVHPPPTLRVNLTAAGREEVVSALSADGVPTDPCRFSAAGLRPSADLPLDRLRAFREGLISVQDEAFQLVGSLLPLSPGVLALDLFAGLGGKSTHLAQRLAGAGAVAALDLSPGKLRRLAAEAGRLRLGGILPAAGDSRHPPFREAAFDAVLLDVPCSGTGVIRRHPDIKWNRAEADIPRLADSQLDFLRAAVPLVRPGGHLLYATCSLETEEDEEVVAAFLASESGFSLVRLHGTLPDDLLTPEGFFRSFPHRHDMDGAFAALLVKRRVGTAWSRATDRV